MRVRRGERKEGGVLIRSKTKTQIALSISNSDGDDPWSVGQLLDVLNVRIESS